MGCLGGWGRAASFHQRRALNHIFANLLEKIDADSQARLRDRQLPRPPHGPLLSPATRTAPLGAASQGGWRPRLRCCWLAHEHGFRPFVPQQPREAALLVSVTREATPQPGSESLLEVRDVGPATPV